MKANYETVVELMKSINDILDRLNTHTNRLGLSNNKKLVADLAWLKLMEDPSVPEQLRGMARIIMKQTKEAYDDAIDATSDIKTDFDDLANASIKFTDNLYE